MIQQIENQNLKKYSTSVDMGMTAQRVDQLNDRNWR